METAKIVFLGTSDSVPSAERNHTAIFLSYKDENILFDCGEGTQRQFRKARINPGKVSRILISHWHGDHVLGIPGMLQTLALSGYNKELFIYGPKGTKKFMDEMMNVFAFSGELNLHVVELTKEGKFYENEDFYLENKFMNHGIPCNAYSFVEKDKLRIDKTKLKKSKLSAGSWIGQLKNGKDVSVEGKKLKAKDFTYLEKGKKISFVFDTANNPKIESFVKDSDLFICEGSFSKDDEDKAKEHKHMTSTEAAQIAKKAKVDRLYLIHVSQRYEKDMNKILSECKKIFKESYLPKDLDIVVLQ